METWLPADASGGAYEVSDEGRVRNAKTGKVLAPMWCGSKGKQYATVSLCVGGAQIRRRVHHLVLLAFVGARPKGGIGCHRDDDKKNNSSANLYWGTWSTNARDRVANGNHFGQRLTVDQVKSIRSRRDGGERGVDLAKEFGVSQQVVWNVWSGRTGRWINDEPGPEETGCKPASARQ